MKRENGKFIIDNGNKQQQNWQWVMVPTQTLSQGPSLSAVKAQWLFIHTFNFISNLTPMHSETVTAILVKSLKWKERKILLSF